MVITEEQRELRERLIDPETYTSVMVDWVRCDADMRNNDQKLKAWTCNIDLPVIGDRVMAFGCSGTVCDYSLLKNKEEQYERCVWIKFKGGEFVKALGSEVSAIDPAELKRREDQNKEFQKKLVAAGKKVENQRKERRARTVKGSHLIEQMLEETTGFEVEKKSSFYKISGTGKDKSIYIAVKGGRVDLSGFNIDSPIVIKISEEHAKNKHLGRVRGQIDFQFSDEEVLDAFRKCLQELK